MQEVEREGDVDSDDEHGFTCPISLVPIENAVQTPIGMHYDKAGIEE